MFMYQTPPIAYECAHLESTTIEKAHATMQELEGWCSEDKATILLNLIFLKKPSKIVEIGVFGGKSLIPMALALKSLGHGKIYGIDPWNKEASCEGMEGDHYEWWHRLDHNKILIGLIDKIVRFELIDVIDLVRAKSIDVMPIEEIDFLHIDGNHSEKTALEDVEKWVPYVKTGGLIVFDDLDWPSTKKAVECLNAQCIPFAEIQDYKPEIKRTCIWGIWIKK